MKKAFIYEKQRFSIRKYSFGAASVLLGASLFLAGQASADEQVGSSQNSLATAQTTTVSGAVQISSEAIQSSAVTPTETSLSNSSATNISAEAASTETQAIPNVESSNQALEATEVTVPAVADSTSSVQTVPEVAANEEVATETVKDKPAVDTEKVVAASVPSAEVTVPSEVKAATSDEANVADPVKKDELTVAVKSQQGTPVAKKTEEAVLDAKQEEKSQAIYRLYNPNSGEHHYTASLWENNNLAKLGWKAEGIGWYAPRSGDAVYRLYNPNSGDHHYTVNKAESNYLDEIGWNYEGVAWYSGGSKAVYRLYNPNAKGAGSHHYTLSKAESTYLDNIGWNAEGIGWYALDVKEPQPTLPAQGTYKFTSEKEVKNEPKVSAKTEFTFRNGDSVNYDKVLEADGHQWISYVSNSGIRRYVDMAVLTTDSDSTPNKQTLTGKLYIQNQMNGDFNVVISNVQDSNGITAVKVPVWTSQSGQDDIVWYDASKQTDGTYKVNVKLSDHKNERGEYNVHLYYVEKNGKLQGVSSTKVTVPDASKSPVVNNGSYYSIQGKYDEIVIANKKYPMSSSYNPGENSAAKAAFVRLRDDMIKKGYNVGTGYSGFRTYSAQASLYQSYVNRDGQAAADRYSARPGYSEHQTGLVFDLTDKSGNLLEDKTATTWLAQNAHNYGFVVRYQPGKEAITGYMPEAWHIRYIGKEAKEVYESGLSLEEYYGFQGGDYANVSNSSSSATTNLPAQGKYNFTSSKEVKNSPSLSAKTEFTLRSGDSVNYDKVLTADGRQWISYVSYSGVRRYVLL